MDRTIVYPASIPQDTDILSPQRNAMVALGYLAQMALGTGTVVDGLACVPTTPASLAVEVGPGSILSLASIDPNPYGTLPADGVDPLVKMGINTTPTSFILAAPTTSGQSINYLIEASFQESDTGAVVLPYYNAANPQQPFAGPANSGITQNTQRIERVELQLKAGAPAVTGTQATPPVDTGWVGLYVVTVNYGATALTQANIATLPGAPFIPFKLPSLRPGFSKAGVFNATGVFTVPAGVSQIRVTVTGGGGGGGGGGGTAENFSGAGGGAGGYGQGVFAVTPGAQFAVTVGAGGGGGGNPGGTGGTSSFGFLISATGGQGGNGGGGSTAAGGSGGGATGGALALGGGVGNDGFLGSSSYPVGRGAASFFGGAGRAGAGGGVPGTAPGAGGGGAYGGVAGVGGAGAPGIVIVEF